MAPRSPRVRERILAPLLLTLTLGATAAAPPRTAESEFRQVLALLERGDVRTAAPRINAALAAFGHQDSEAVWGLRIFQGWLFYRNSQLEEARKILEPEPPPKHATSETAVRRLYYLGFVLNQESYFAAAIELARQHQPRLLADALFAASRAGDPKLKDQRKREALRAARQHQTPVVELRIAAATALDLANADRFDEAIQITEPVLPRAAKLNVGALTTQMVGNLAWFYAELGDQEQAEKLYTEAAHLAARGGHTKEHVRWLTNLGHLRRHARDFGGAHRYYSHALAVAPPAHPTRGQIYRSFGVLALERGQLDEARRRVAEARAFKYASNDMERDPQLRTDLVEARIHVAAGQYREAGKLFERIGKAAAAKDVEWDAKARLAMLYSKQGRDAEAEERFREVVASAFDVRKEVKDNDLRLSFLNLVNDTFDAYTDFLVSRSRVDDALTVTESSRARTLEEMLNVPPSRKTLDARKIAKEHDATIFSYWLGAQRSLVWVVTPAGNTVYPLASEEAIAREVEAYQRDLMAVRGSFAMTSARGRKLYEMLVPPQARAIAPGSRVIVVPDGRLNALNFETLVVPSPKPHFWIEDAVLMTANSLELVARRSRTVRAPQPLLLVGDPPKVDPKFPPLAHASAEIDRVQRHFANPAVLRKEKATPAAYLKSAPERYDVLHFVAHGVANRLKPLDSAVILGKEGDEYKLYAHEIVKKPLEAHLVTISSCHGAGTRTYGEGLVGLAWAFLGAGAENVIAALWEVDDRATPQLMDDLYAGIRAGRDPATALREAKLKMVRSDGIHNRARYWAPFVLYSGS